MLAKLDYKFKGRSDCETIVALYQYYGLSFLSKLNGEYAICIHDSERKLFFAARDRSGVKPLYWTVIDRKLLVDSEAKAFLPLRWKPELDVRSLVDGGWNTDSRTIFKSVRKARPRETDTSSCLPSCRSHRVSISHAWLTITSISSNTGILIIRIRFACTCLLPIQPACAWGS